jgi:hypothetical protein
MARGPGVCYLPSAALDTCAHSAHSARRCYLERVSRMQELVLDEVRTRTGRPDPADPRTGAIVGAAFSCLIAAWCTWLTTDQAKPFAVLLDQALGAIRPT